MSERQVLDEPVDDDLDVGDDLSTVGPAGVAPFSDRALGWLLLVGGGVGWLAAFVLMVEKVALLEDSSYTPSCNLSPILSCGSVMITEQAEAFGFANPLLGITGFAIVTATGAAILAGARLRRWYWLGLQMGVLAGLAFVAWLVFQSLYRIGALCPYCMVVWAMTIPIAWYTTLRNARVGVLGAGVARSGVVRVLGQWHLLGVVALYAVVVVLAGEQFWYYWRTLL